MNVRVGEIAEQLRGVSYAKSDATSEPRLGFVPILRANNITDDGLVFDDLVYVPKSRVSEKQALRRGDIIIAASSGSLNVVGKAAQLKQEFQGAFGAFCKVLRPKNGAVDPNYLSHFFRTQSYRQKISSLAAGANINNLKNEHLDDLKIPLPPLDEQRRIAAILDKADALRRKRKRALELLDSLTQSIFLEMFREHLNETPDTKLEDFAEIQVGFAFKSSEYTEEPDGVRLCRGANILPNAIDWSDLVRWPKGREGEFLEYDLRPGDIVIAMDRPWISSGFKAARLSSTDLPALLVQRVARLRAKTEADGDFLYALVQSPLFGKHFKPTETTVPHISPIEIRKFSFSVPPRGMRQRFAAFTANARHALRAAAASSAKVELLFSSLQYRAFSGQL